jgi:hypothetical protein
MTTSYKVDTYSVRVYANDLDGSLAQWAAKTIYMYSNGKHVASAFFAKEGDVAPDAIFADELIYFHAQAEQYSAVLDLLRNEKPVYINWKPQTDEGEPDDGVAYFNTGQEPTGEEE